MPTRPMPASDPGPGWLRRQWRERRAIVAWSAAAATGFTIACLATR